MAGGVFGEPALEGDPDTGGRREQGEAKNDQPGGGGFGSGSRGIEFPAATRATDEPAGDMRIGLDGLLTIRATEMDDFRDHGCFGEVL